MNWDEYESDESDKPSTPPVELGGTTEAEESQSVELVDGCASRIHVDDKQMINCRADLNQLVPFKYEWAWLKYLEACSHHWSPGEVKFETDLEDIRELRLSLAESQLIAKCIENLGLAGHAASSEYILGCYRLVTNPECRQYILRQLNEDATHKYAYQQASTVLNINSYQCHQLSKSEVLKKIWVEKNLNCLKDPVFNTGTQEDNKAFLKSLVSLYLVKEKLFNVSSELPLLAIGRAGFLTGLSEMQSKISRDKQMHTQFGIDVINQIKIENSEVWSPSFQEEVRQIIIEGTEIELMFVAESIPHASNEINQGKAVQYIYNTSNTLMSEVGLMPVYPETINPYPWVKEVGKINLKKVDHLRAGGSLNW